MDFSLSAQTRDLMGAVQAFFDDELLPRNRDWRRYSEAHGRDPAWFKPLRAQARQLGLWNMGLSELPAGAPGTPLSNLAFAGIAEIMGRLPWASVIYNCHPPDLPNMITLLHAANPEQQQRWLWPLLTGEVRSAFAMTEPAVASSDARNIALRMDRTDRGYCLDGRKWYASGAAHADCEFLIVLGATGDAGARDAHTAVVVPMATPGLRVVRELRFMGSHDRIAPIAELAFDGVEVPFENRLGAEGEGFAVAQTRLGPARVHHAMRAIGLAEVMLELMLLRGSERRAFGRHLHDYDTIQGWIARSRIEIEQARLLVQKAAWMLDQRGHSGAWREVSMVKVAVPGMLQQVADRAVQVFGALGGGDDAPIHTAYAWARGFRIFDGPDEVHLRQLFRQESLPPGTLAESPYMWPEDDVG